MAALAQAGQRRAGHQEGGVEVAAQRLGPALGRRGREVTLEVVGLGGRDHAGVVDHDVQLPEGRMRLTGHLVGRAGLGQVSHEAAGRDTER